MDVVKVNIVLCCQVEEAADGNRRESHQRRVEERAEASTANAVTQAKVSNPNCTVRSMRPSLDNLHVGHSQTEADSVLALLFQFLHLQTLFHPQQSFAEPALPTVVARATGAQAAAVGTLFEAFANGPLMGGGDDALTRLQRLYNSDEEDVIPGVSCKAGHFVH